MISNLLLKFIGIGVLVWFFKTAQKVGEKSVKWAIIGVIGYALAAALTHFLITDVILDRPISSKSVWQFFNILPSLAGLTAAYFVRKKFLLKGKTVESEK